MILWQSLSKNLFIKLLSLALAIALWLLASGSKKAVRDFSIPLMLQNTPPGLSVSGQIPASIAVTVAGPKIRLLGLRPDEMTLELDMSSLREGTVTFSSMEKRLLLPPGISLMRIYPSVVEVKLVPTAKSGKR